MNNNRQRVRITMLTCDLIEEVEAITGKLEFSDEINDTLEHCFYVACMNKDKAEQLDEFVRILGIEIEYFEKTSKNESILTVLSAVRNAIQYKGEIGKCVDLIDWFNEKAESLEALAVRYERCPEDEQKAEGARKAREDAKFYRDQITGLNIDIDTLNRDLVAFKNQLEATTEGEELAENEEEVNTMTTENTITTTAEENAETKQQKADRENRDHCKRIADELEAVAEGRVYKCPECGELVGIENLVYDEDTQTYTCTQCGKTFDECDLESVGMFDYFDDVLDIEYRIGSDREFRSVRLLVAYGGPNIYIDTCSRQVELYWWTDRASFPLSDEVCDQINADFEELFNC